MNKKSYFEFLFLHLNSSRVAISYIREPRFTGEAKSHLSIKWSSDALFTHSTKQTSLGKHPDFAPEQNLFFSSR